MVKRVSDKGFTLIEMIFVLLLTCILLSLTIPKLFDAASIKFKQCCEQLKVVQYDSLIHHTKHEISIYDSTLMIDDKKVDLSPLVCQPVFFHYNKRGHISKAFTLTCFHHQVYQAKFQLGSGWILYE